MKKFFCDISSRITEARRPLGPVIVYWEPGVGLSHEVGVLSSDGVHCACINSLEIYYAHKS